MKHWLYIRCIYYNIQVLFMWHIFLIIIITMNIDYWTKHYFICSHRYFIKRLSDCQVRGIAVPIKVTKIIVRMEMCMKRWFQHCWRCYCWKLTKLHKCTWWSPTASLWLYSFHLLDNNMCLLLYVIINYIELSVCAAHILTALFLQCGTWRVWY